MSINHRIIKRLLPVALVVLQQTAVAQSIFDFDEWMQRIDRRSQSIQRNLARKDAHGASVDAEELGDLYGSMETFFARRGDAPTAVKLSKDGRQFAAAVVKSATAGDFAAASQAALEIAHACRTCHLQYKPLQ
jgi:hypothetical protein